MTAWEPVASQRVLLERAQRLALIRDFFAIRGVQELQTPNLSITTVTDPNIQSIRAGDRFLQTSPEYHMKRMLASGCGDLFQITQAFRNDEVGRNHQPEFTMLEWYRVGMQWRQLAMEVCQLIEYLAIGARHLEPAEFFNYQDIFSDLVGLDPLQVSEQKIQEKAQSLGLYAATQVARDALLEFLFDQCVVPSFKSDRVTVVYNFPASQAALAKLDAGNLCVAQRFECYLQGYELANGFAELSDAAVQRSRFEVDNISRNRVQQDSVTIDERLLSALEYGLPDCSGVALGFDRLLQAIFNQSSIETVIAFPWNRA